MTDTMATSAEVEEPIAVSVQTLATQIGCSSSHLYRLARAGELPGAYRLGSRWFVVIETFRRETEAA